MDRCSGHGRCYSLQPDLFGVDDQGFPVILDQEVSPSMERAAVEASEACPERAISTC
jgi:ferredoxin